MKLQSNLAWNNANKTHSCKLQLYKNEENKRKTKRQVSFYAKASDVKSVFLYKPAYICTHVQKDMF